VIVYVQINYIQFICIAICTIHIVLIQLGENIASQTPSEQANGDSRIMEKLLKIVRMR